ncbi:MAG: ComEC/Rec2 family competence protein [Cellulomonas sp.]|jgi:competence protein ComEC|nr:ComEC/Rec2 family competence protein [Cellulomonas sp.]
MVQPRKDEPTLVEPALVEPALVEPVLEPVLVEPVDLRLLPAAVMAWVGAVVVVLAPLRWTVVTAGCCLGVATAAVSLRRRWSGSLVLAAGVMAAVLLAGAAQQQVRWSGRWSQAVAERWNVTVTGTTTTVPAPSGYGGCRYLLDVSALHAHGSGTVAAAPIQVTGETCQLLAPGAEVSVDGRLGALPTGRAVAGLRAAGPARLADEPPAWSSAADQLRAAGQRQAAALPEPLDALLPGIVWGDTAGLDDETTEQLRTAGLTHLTAVSGAHFAIVVTTVLGLGVALRLGRAVRVAAAVVVGCALVILVGPQPSVLRAAVMGAVGVLGLVAGRRSAAPAALATTVVALLLLDPWLATELGFQLSVAATAGIVGLGGGWVRRWSAWVPRPLAVAVAVPLSAQLAVTPVLLTVTPQVSTYAVLANLAVAPVVAPVTVLGLLGLALSVGWSAGAQVLVWLAAAGCAWIVQVARTAADAPGATVAWLPGPLGWAAGTGTVLAVVVLLSRAPPGRAGASSARAP